MDRIAERGAARNVLLLATFAVGSTFIAACREKVNLPPTPSPRNLDQVLSVLYEEVARVQIEVDQFKEEAEEFKREAEVVREVSRMYKLVNLHLMREPILLINVGNSSYVTYQLAVSDSIRGATLMSIVDLGGNVEPDGNIRNYMKVSWANRESRSAGTVWFFNDPTPSTKSIMAFELTDSELSDWYLGQTVTSRPDTPKATIEDFMRANSLLETGKIDKPLTYKFQRLQEQTTYIPAKPLIYPTNRSSRLRAI